MWIRNCNKTGKKKGKKGAKVAPGEAGKGEATAAGSSAPAAKEETKPGKAAAPESKGNCLETVMYVADGPTGTMDTAFPAHVLCTFHWSLAIWQQWVRVGPVEAARGVVPAGASGRLVRGAGKELNVPATRGGAESVIR